MTDWPVDSLAWSATLGEGPETNLNFRARRSRCWQFENTALDLPRICVNLAANWSLTAVEMKNIDQILQSFRSDLPSGSKTAAAIDRGASLEEISELAEQEGLHNVATVLFEAEQEALRKGPEQNADATAATDEFIRVARENLPSGSKTAAAIDRGASWEEISELAEQEGLHQLASALFEAEQEQLRNSS